MLRSVGRWRGLGVVVLVGTSAALLACSTFRDVEPFEPVDGGSDVPAVHVPEGCDGETGEALRAFGPVLLYLFDEADGDLAHDCGGRLAQPLDLSVVGEATAWLEPGLQLGGASKAIQLAPRSLYDVLAEDDGSFSIELWYAPASTDQVGPARIVTMSPNFDVANFMLGAEVDQLALRLRTTGTFPSGNIANHLGDPVELMLVDGAVTTPTLTHIAVTYGAPADLVSDGTLVVYVNGGEYKRNAAVPGVPEFSLSYPLVLGNTGDDSRPWRGTFFRLSVFDRELDAAEVADLSLIVPGAAQ